MRAGPTLKMGPYHPVRCRMKSIVVKSTRITWREPFGQSNPPPFEDYVECTSDVLWFPSEDPSPVDAVDSSTCWGFCVAWRRSGAARFSSLSCPGRGGQAY